MNFLLRSCLFMSALSVLLSGCLTVESKEYHIKLKTDHSGEARIKFVNILSEADDTTDISNDDFQQLIDLYINGNQLETENPGFHNVKKRLFEENGVLVGEITFTFDSLGTVRLFKFDKESPYMYFVGSPLSSEQLVETNGLFGRDWMPIVFWTKETTELYVKTRVISEVAYHRGLLKQYNEWLATQPKPKKQ